MKKSFILIIVFLLLIVLALPVAFAEGGDFSRDNQIQEIGTDVLSNMDNYMKLENPVAIDKTENYLAVANAKKLFVKFLTDKTKSDYYMDLISTETEDTITKLVIINDRVVVLVKDKLSTSKLIIINIENKNTTNINNYTRVYNISKFDNKLALVNSENLNICTILNNNISIENTYSLAVGTTSIETFKFFNNTAYIINNNTSKIHKCILNGTQYEITDDTKLVEKKIIDYCISNDNLYFIDANNDLYINNKKYDKIANTTFNQLLVENDTIITTAISTSDNTLDNGKVYYINSSTGAVSKLITSKGDDLYRFDSPESVYSDGTYIYIADTNNSRIIKRDVKNDNRIQVATKHKPNKVVAVGEKIYYLSENALYLVGNDNDSIMDKVQSIARWNDKLLILSENKLYINDINNLLINSVVTGANDITTAFGTNYVYVINKTNGNIAKYNLEKPESPIFTTSLEAGRNYNIDFRGNMFVENNGNITKYSQEKTEFVKVNSFKVAGVDENSNISTCVDSINAKYYFTNINDHLLFSLNDTNNLLNLVGTNNIDYTAPEESEMTIIKAGRIITEEAKAFITPNNPESARYIHKDEVFLILAVSVLEESGENYYYVASENIAQREYIKCSEIELIEDVKINNVKMSALVKNVPVYKYPYKHSDKLKFVLTPDIEVVCIAKVAGNDIWNWYKIIFNDGSSEVTGYVKAEYLAKVTPSSPPKNIIFMKTKAPKIGTNIKIYASPDINSEVLFDNIKDGIDIQIVGDYNANNTFTKVLYNDKVGYILNENLQPNGLTPNQIIAISITSVAIVAFTLIALLFMHKNKTAKKKVEETEPDILG